MTTRLFTFIAAFCAITSINARELTPAEALYRVTEDTALPATTRSLVNGSPVLTYTAKTTTGTPAAYIFNSKATGFMIVSADDAVTPLLGYGTAEAETGTLPPSLVWWLDQYAEQINAGRSQTQQYVYQPRRSAAMHSIAPMVTTRWNQDAPFNNDCPTVNGSKAVTGCVATAMAQVMKYYNWPASGTGSVSYTDSYGNSYSMDFGSFDWASMLDRYEYNGTTPQFTTTEASAVAYLMKSCGYSVEMSYSASASGAVSSNAVNALINNFGYDKAIYSADRNYYGLTEWEDMIYNNLATTGPVIYSGSNYSGSEGHCFVCDGYSSDGYFHFNWGWGGSYNGYFLLTALQPEGVGIGGGSGMGFSFNQEAILGIQKPVDGSTPHYSPLTQYGNLTASIQNGNIQFSISTGSGGNSGFFNLNSGSITVELGAIYEAANGQTTPAGTGQSNTVDRYSGYSRFTAPLPSVSSGTYKVYPACRVNGGEWTRMLQEISAVQYVTLTYNNGKPVVSIPTTSTLSVDDVDMTSGFYLGNYYTVTATIFNNGDNEILTGVATGFAKTTNGQLTLQAAGETIVVDIEGNGYNTYTFYSTFESTNGSFTAGDYTFVIYEPATNKVLYSAPCTVNANPGTPTLTATNFTLTGGNTNVNPATMQFNIDVSCSAGYLSTPLTINIFKMQGTSGTFVDAVSTSEPMYMTANQTKRATINYNFSEAEPGQQYVAQLTYAKGTSSAAIGTIYFTVSDEVSGITDVSGDTDDTVVYYNLQGQPVSNPVKGTIYIKQTAQKVEKIVY